MNLAQVIGLVQARLRKRRPPRGPWAILPLGHCTRAPERRKNEAKKSCLPSKASRLVIVLSLQNKGLEPIRKKQLWVQKLLSAKVQLIYCCPKKSRCNGLDVGLLIAHPGLTPATSKCFFSPHGHKMWHSNVMEKAAACRGNDASDLGSIPTASKWFSKLLGIRWLEGTSHDRMCGV